MLSRSIRGLTLIAIISTPLAAQAQDDKDAEIARLKKKLDAQKEIIDALKEDYADFKRFQKEAALSLAQLKATQERLNKEIDLLNKTIKDREKEIVRGEAEIRRYRNEAVQMEALAKTRQIQNGTLTEEIRELTARLARLQKGENPGPAPRNPNAPNPPQARMNGKVEKVDGDLVVVTLGTDHGLSKGNTLDVYRLAPEAKYLGMIRIVETNLEKSVGRLVPVGNAAFRSKLKEGDLVTSSLPGTEKPKAESPKNQKMPPAEPSK